MKRPPPFTTRRLCSWLRTGPVWKSMSRHRRVPVSIADNTGKRCKISVCRSKSLSIQVLLKKIRLELPRNPSNSICFRCVRFDSSILLMNPHLAVPWFPPLRSPVLIEIYAIAHASRVPCEEFIVPHFTPARKPLEPLRVAESTDHVVLCDLADTAFEFFYSGMTARQKESREGERNEQTPFPLPGHLYSSAVNATSQGFDQTTCTRAI
jgi:hypothetical protein